MAPIAIAETTEQTHPTERPKKAAAFGRYAVTAARVLLGLVFFVFGLNGFFNFIPAPTTPMPEGAVAFGTALMQSGYMMPLVKGTEVLGGVLLLTNRFVPLALALLAPVVVNILAFHVFLETSGLGLAVVLLGVELYLAWAYREVFRPMLAMRVAPRA